MTNEKNTKENILPNKRVYFIKGFILCLILLVPFQCVKDSLMLMSEDSASIRQYLIMLALRNHIDSIGEVPDNLADIRFPEPKSEGVYICKDIFYYPDAWGKPGQILLRSKYLISCSYVVTFGDGSTGVLTRWHYKYRQDNKEDVKPKTIYAGSPLPSLLKLLWLILLVIAFFNCQSVLAKKRQSMSNP